MEKMFSVVVPVYNVEKYIHKCVLSILNQTFCDFELILVDDGSPDNCPAICDEYAAKDSRVRVLHKMNSGLVGARKSGAMAALGKYIVCVDGDDWLEKDYLAENVHIISRYNPDVIVCNYYTAYSTDRKKENPMFVKPGYYDKNKLEKAVYSYLIEDSYGRYFPPSVCAKTFRREPYTKIQLEVPDEIAIGEDQACTKPILFNADSMYVLDKCIYNYRQNLSSMTKSKKAFSWEAPKAIGLHFERFIDMTNSDFQAQVYRNIVHNLFNVAVSQFNRQASYKSIKKNIIENLSDCYYQKAIRDVEYFGFKNKLASIALKRRLVFLMFLYNRFK